MPIYSNFYQTLTTACPIVELRGYAAACGLKGHLYAYLDFNGPTGTARDGLAEGMLALAIEKKQLDPVRSRFSTIRREPISLEQKVRSVLSYAREHRHFKFSDVLERESDRLEIVVAFLAVLELMKMGRIHLVQEKLFDEMQLDTVDVDETEGEAELELSTEEGEEYARIR